MASTDSSGKGEPERFLPDPSRRRRNSPPRGGFFRSDSRVTGARRISGV